MQDVVERLLALARAESADPSTTRAAVPLEPLIRDVAAWLAPMAKDRYVSIAVSGEPVVARGDPAQLREALCQVVTNAIQYNRRGGRVTITSRLQGEEALVEIADTGPGMPAAAVPQVFDRFFRADQARARDAGGAGLGLSVARAVVEAHGGSIACSSEEGVGTVFTIALPASIENLLQPDPGIFV
jgi:two-component system sensor histidine kinase BaeS